MNTAAFVSASATRRASSAAAAAAAASRRSVSILRHFRRSTHRRTAICAATMAFFSAAIRLRAAAPRTCDCTTVAA